jgi:uncharacterized protein YkwD
MSWILKFPFILFVILGVVVSMHLNACGILYNQTREYRNPTLDSMNTAVMQTLVVKLTRLTPSPTFIVSPLTQTLAEVPTIPQSQPTESLMPSMTPIPQIATVEPQTETTLSLPCDWAQFISYVTIPDGSSLAPGFRFTKTWRLMNAGNCTWTPAYKLVYASGDLMGAVGAVSFLHDVKSGEMVDISVELTAPQQPGTYQGNWMLKNAQGQVFGIGPNADGAFWVNIVVPSSGDIIPAAITATSTQASTTCQVTGNASYEAELLKLINQERAKKGFFLLISQSQLLNAARGHSKDMACNNFYNHKGSDGSSPAERIAFQGYVYSAGVENIYAGEGVNNTPLAAFNSWLDNPEYHANILNGYYTQVGIGYMFNSESTLGGYYTAIFARP